MVAKSVTEEPFQNEFKLEVHGDCKKDRNSSEGGNQEDSVTEADDIPDEACLQLHIALSSSTKLAESQST